MVSRETTPIPTPNLDSGSPVQPSDLKVTVINSSNKAQETELSEKLGGGALEYVSGSSLPSVNSCTTLSECDSPSTSVENKRKSTFKTNPGKKRLKCPENWIDNKRKSLLNSGQQYVSRGGKLKNKKELRPACSTSCKLKCFDKFDTDVRQNIHSNFWQLADHTKQWEFINKFTKKILKKRMTTEGPSRRQFTTKYFLPAPKDDTFKTEQVCMKMFLNTFSITDQFVRTAHSKLNQEGITLTDNRGKHAHHPTVVDSEMIKSVCDHVASLQPIESHYTRKDNSKLYLDSNLNMSRMFALYKRWDQLLKYSNQAHTLRQYRDVINSNMNVTFFVPKKDMRDKCHSYSNDVSPTEQ
ncbi:unnamed protein product [Danaus chrysippus]|uniref:(African queen) hypothetical protein n=1 Tax=Danaus chrysippus TaxID=151541 RepID=A0A8J2RFI3_9NEOP|nr:unnamed protein product [Danaus chrysippus]